MRLFPRLASEQNGYAIKAQNMTARSIFGVIQTNIARHKACFQCRFLRRQGAKVALQNRVRPAYKIRSDNVASEK
jgi:hypothetical protein